LWRLSELGVALSQVQSHHCNISGAESDCLDIYAWRQFAGGEICLAGMADNCLCDSYSDQWLRSHHRERSHHQLLTRIDLGLIPMGAARNSNALSRPAADFTSSFLGRRRPRHHAACDGYADRVFRVSGAGLLLQSLTHIVDGILESFGKRVLQWVGVVDV